MKSRVYKDRPFIDSYGARGYPYDKYHTDHKKIKSINRKSLQFEKLEGRIILSIPDTVAVPAKLQITNLNALKLAHWLLDSIKEDK